ncbi:snaclec bitiscetin subunit alpha-like [Huso huso]|uniref:Snaclec bitiscetin subunit alpha-like n=1 Tax=Huso huso TaxID=61971 RepID=A0ABR0Y0T4_HUSHU
MFFSSSGLCVPAYNQIRKYMFVETVKSWSEAQRYCRENHIDLATVRSQEEATQLLSIVGASVGDSWIGLYRDDTQNWQWSNSDDVIYSNWRADVFCASVNSEGKWIDLPCNLQNAFMCYKGKDIIIYIYIAIDYSFILVLLIIKHSCEGSLYEFANPPTSTAANISNNFSLQIFSVKTLNPSCP